MSVEDIAKTSAGFENENMEMDDPKVGEKRDISGDGGIFKEIIKLGEDWETPEKGDKVTVHYVGTLESDGSEFDSSRGRGDPFTFSVGQGSVIKGWDVGIPTMKRGEIAKFTIRSDYAYGDSGSPPKIPGGATLVFEVELIDWKSVKDIVGDGGIIKTIVKEGDGWANPRDDDEVKVHLTAKVLQTPKESSTAVEEAFFFTPEEGIEFTVKEGFLCKAVPVAVKKMKKGEQANLIIKPEYGFGDEGDANRKVPPGARLEINLTLESWKKVEKVTTDGGVIKKTLVESSEWQRPNAGATVTITYTARDENYTIVEEKTDADPAKFITEEEQAPCEGLELAVMQMKKGERALVTVKQPYTPSDVEYLTYDVTLVDFEKAKETWEMSVEEKIEAARIAKEKGNVAFKAGKNERAKKLWDRAKQAVEYDDSFDSENKKTAKEIKRSCELNLAAVNLKSGNFKQACKEATQVLEADSFHLKALYRRAQAYIGMGDWVEAAQDIKKALGVDPGNTDFRVLAKKLRAAEAEATKGEAQLWSSSFAKMAASRNALEQNAMESNATEKEAASEQ